ncbi:MAG: hypothetical protein ACLFPX_00030 [Candidatus Omnitrophota bacterium]
MENVFSFTPLQQVVILMINVWMFAIFPILVLKKLNYISDLLEAQFEDEEGDPPEFS